MLMKIKCPSCETEGTMSLVEKDYEGPYRCWKCRALFSIRLEDNKLTACEPLSEEELEKIQEIEAIRKKMGRE